MKRIQMCRRCRRIDGHNTISCKATDEEIADMPRIPITLSEKAAALAREQGMTYRAAAKQFGISSQSVYLGWVSLYGRPTTSGRQISERAQAQRDQIKAMVDSGMTGPQIAKALDLDEAMVRNIASRGGFSLLQPRDYSAAIAVLQAGGSLTEAGKACGKSRSAVWTALKKLGVRSSHRGRLRPKTQEIEQPEAPADREEA